MRQLGSLSLWLLALLMLNGCTDTALVERWSLYYAPYHAQSFSPSEEHYIQTYASQQQCQQGGVDQVLHHRGIGQFVCVEDFSHPSHPNHTPSQRNPPS